MNEGFDLRDYQRDFLRAVCQGFLHGKPDAGQKPFTRLLGVAATGAGKTIIASALIWWITDRKPRRFSNRVLMLADTDELVAQAADKIYQSTGIFVDLEKAEKRASLDAPVVVGSIQSMSRRLERWPADHFGLVIADEAHLSMSAMWQRTLKHFNGGGSWILGITATPERSDGQKLMRYYEDISAEIGLFHLIERKHLAPITVQVCPISIDCSGLETKKKGIGKGEFDGDELEEAIEPYLEAIIDQWQLHAADRKTLVFHPSIKASMKFSEMLKARGIASEHVSGQSGRDRKGILQRYEAGRFQVLNNAQLLTKGYDCPDIACIINLRPTRSRTQYLQMVGRGTRNAPGKTDLLLLDFLWQFQELGIQRPASLIAGTEEQEKEISKVLERGLKMPLGEASEEAERERERQVIDRLREAATRGAGGRYDARELGAVLHQQELIHYEPRAKWERREITEGQRRFFMQQGIDPATVKGLGHAAKIMQALSRRRTEGRATPAQLQQLLIAGVERAHEKRYSEAVEILSDIKRQQPTTANHA